MLRDIFTNKWILGGIGFLVIFTGLCYLWYQHNTAPYRKQAAELDEMIHQFEKQRTASTVKSTEPAADAPVESTMPTTEKSINETTSGTDRTEPTQAQSNVPAQNAETETEVRVSPHGFGPYPEVPEDYPYEVDWTLRGSRSKELLTRVLIKLWTEGEKNFRGGGTHNGKVYPWYHNTIYVKIRYYENADGELVPGGSTKMSGPRVDWSAVKDWTNPPPHIRILDLDSSGINPYQYLNLR